MRVQQSRPTLRKAAGIAAIVLGVTMAVGLSLTVFKVWSWLGAHLLPPATRVMWWGLQLQAGLDLIVVGILGTWLTYGLWRLANDRPGTGQLRLAFVLTLGSWVLFLALTSALTLGSSSSPVANQALFTSYTFGPLVLRLIASLLLAYGLVRSGLASRPLAWLAVAAAVLGGGSVALSAPAYWDMAALGATRFGMALARFQWVGNASQLLYVVFWIALGFILLRTPGALTQDPTPDVGHGLSEVSPH